MTLTRFELIRKWPRQSGGPYFDFIGRSKDANVAAMYWLWARGRICTLKKYLCPDSSPLFIAPHIARSWLVTVGYVSA